MIDDGYTVLYSEQIKMETEETAESEEAKILFVARLITVMFDASDVRVFAVSYS